MTSKQNGPYFKTDIFKTLSPQLALAGQSKNVMVHFLSLKLALDVIGLKLSEFPASFSVILGLIKQTIQFLQQINVKNVHSVYCAEI